MGRQEEPIPDGPVVQLQDIAEQDILCGKDKKCINHPGSRNFKTVIDKYAEKYQQCLSKFEKMNITKEIYDRMTGQSARFLKYNAQEDSWHIIPIPHIRDKIGHALRFANKKANKARGKGGKKKLHKRKRDQSRSSMISSDSDVTMDTATSSSHESLSSNSSSEQPRQAPAPMNFAPRQLVAHHNSSMQFLLDGKVERRTWSDRIPSSVSFPKEQPTVQAASTEKLALPEPAPLPQLPVTPLPDEDILYMLREPLVDFDPHANNIISAVPH